MDRPSEGRDKTQDRRRGEDIYKRSCYGNRRMEKAVLQDDPSSWTAQSFSMSNRISTDGPDLLICHM